MGALGAPCDVAHRPVATEFAGIAELYRRDPSLEHLQTLLESLGTKARPVRMPSRSRQLPEPTAHA